MINHSWFLIYVPFRGKFISVDYTTIINYSLRSMCCNRTTQKNLCVLASWGQSVRQEMVILVSTYYFCVQHQTVNKRSADSLLEGHQMLRAVNDRLMLLSRIWLSVHCAWWKLIVCLCVCLYWCQQTLHVSSSCSLVISPSLPYLLNPARHYEVWHVISARLSSFVTCCCCAHTDI